MSIVNNPKIPDLHSNQNIWQMVKCKGMVDFLLSLVPSGNGVIYCGGLDVLVLIALFQRSLHFPICCDHVFICRYCIHIEYFIHKFYCMITMQIGDNREEGGGDIPGRLTVGEMVNLVELQKERATLRSEKEERMCKRGESLDRP